MLREWMFAARKTGFYKARGMPFLKPAHHFYFHRHRRFYNSFTRQIWGWLRSVADFHLLN